jgi:hypothetical protein
MAKPKDDQGLNEQGRRAQEQALRAKGYGYDADAVRMGLVEYDADWLENTPPLTEEERAAYPQKFSW